MLDALPTVILPGNHDVYTPRVQREQRMRQWFGAWMAMEGPISRSRHGTTTVLGLDPNRPTWVTAAGQLPQEQLVALAEALADPDVARGPVVLGLHYPTDVAAGALIGGVMGYVSTAYLLEDVALLFPG